MPKINNPYEYKEYMKKLNDEYKGLMSLINIDDVKNKLGKEFDLDNQYSAWVNDYLGGTPCEKARELYTQLIETDSLQLVVKDIENVFKKIYIVIPNETEETLGATVGGLLNGQIGNSNSKTTLEIDDVLDKNYNIIATFMPGIFQDELTNDNTFSINTFLQTQEEIKQEEPKEYIDPLHYLDTQKEIDEYTEKVKNDEITIVEMLDHFGYKFVDVDNDKVKKLIDEIVTGQISDNEFRNKVASNEITLGEIQVIDAQLKLAYPEVYKKLNS